MEERDFTKLATGSRGDVFVVRTSKPFENLWKNGLFWSRYSFVTHSIDAKPRDWGLARSAYSIECFHMTSRWPHWCPKTMKRRPRWCPKQVLWELNSFLMQTLSFVPINLHRCWPREWKHYKIRKGRKQIWGRSSNPWNSNGIEWNRLILLTWSRIPMYLPNTVGKRHEKAFKFIFDDRNLRLRDSAFVCCASQQMVTEMT